jgi:hypothetical protein
MRGWKRRGREGGEKSRKGEGEWEAQRKVR